MAEVLALSGSAAAATRVLGCAEQLREQVGLKWPQWALEMNEETLTSVRASLPGKQFGIAYGEGGRSARRTRSRWPSTRARRRRPPADRTDFKAWLNVASAGPGGRMEIQELVGEGDAVVARFAYAIHFRTAKR